jgi:hypothetical protein
MYNYRMNKPLQLIGERFARLVVLQRSETSRHGQAYWLCQCDCGDQTTVSSRRLTSGNTRSCGCLRKEKDGGKIFAQINVVSIITMKKKVKHV